MFALESAMLDALGKARGEPAWRLMRDRADGVPAPLPIAALLSGATLEAVIAEATAAVARGLRVGKVKVNGRDSARELARVVAIHRAVEPLGMRLRLDANRSFSNDDLLRWADFAAVAPDVFEEPVGSIDWRRISSSDVRLGMDESLLETGWQERAEACAGRGIVGAFVLKPMAAGGWLRCIDLAQRSRELAWWTYVTHLFDGPIAAAATAELALSLGGESHPSGIDLYGRSDDWPTLAPLQIGESHIMPLEHHGLGVDAIAGKIWGNR
jgi:L-alanine-DL-glutamate epimerase-like enolase superfamily enzyme